tara:strand:- start:2017 stop:3681 length:1665 start_codon:yes stop_codon:yes gene_type:complete
MAKVETFPLLGTTSVLADHVIYVVNETADTDNKLQLNTLFPTISDNGSAGQLLHTGSLTNLTQINLKKIATASTSSGALTATTHADGHLLISLVEASLNLANCSNSSSGFITTVNLATNVGSTILPVANGGTGAASLTDGGILLGSGTGAVTAMAVLAKGSIIAGDGTTDPAVVTVGTNGYLLQADSTAGAGVSWLQTLPVANGGTGATTLTANGVLIGNGTSAVTSVALATKGQILVGDGTGNPSALTVGTDGQLLMANAAAGSGVQWINNHLDLLDEFVMPGSTVLDMNNNIIDLGTGWLSGNGTAEGINIDAAGKVFIGEDTPTAFFDTALNFIGDITVSGASVFQAKAVSGAGSNISLIAGGSTGAAGGGMVVKGGNSTGGNGNGGNLTLGGGIKNGSGTDGTIVFKTGDTEAMSITAAQDLNVKKSIIFNDATEGIVYTSMGTVTQATNHSTTVTVNAMAGVITLAAIALGTGAEAQFQINNSAVQADSLILLTVDSPVVADSTDDSCVLAQVTGKADGSFKVILKNVGDANTDANARKINFLIINNSV